MAGKQPIVKTISWSYGIVIAFTAVYLVGGILLDRQANKKEKAEQQRD